MHALTDGRDCEDGTSIKLMDTLQRDLQALEKQGVDARVASGGGRMCTTMDRYEVLRLTPADDAARFQGARPCRCHSVPRVSSLARLKPIMHMG